MFFSLYVFFFFFGIWLSSREHFLKKVRYLINCLFFFASLYPARKQNVSKSSQVYLLKGASSIPILSVRSTHVYKHITSLGIFNEHIPHPKVSAECTVSASAVLSQPHVWTKTTSAKQPQFQAAKAVRMGHMLDWSYLHMKMWTPVLPPCSTKMSFWGRKPRFTSVFREIHRYK